MFLMMRPELPLVLLVANLLIAAPAFAEQVPQWEAGAGMEVIDIPQYRGSNERRNYLLPVPYFIYRGNVLKIDRQRVRGLFYHNDYAELDFSVNGSVPVNDSVVRRGMPDLDPTLEIGPSLNFYLYESKSNEAHLEFRMPVRLAIASDFSYLHDVGWILQPQLNLDVENAFNQRGWNMGVGAGPIFTDRRYNQFYYGVDARYALPNRPAYNVGGGYAGSQFVITLSKRFPGIWVGGFIRWDTLVGAAFEESPLVKSKKYAAAGFAISWIFMESSITVDADE